MALPELPESQASTFLVERYWPGVTRPALDAAVDRVRRVLEDPSGDGGPVTHIGTLLVDADEVVFCLFSATSREAVDAVNQRAGFPFDRIVGGTWLSRAAAGGHDAGRPRGRRVPRSRLAGLGIVSALLLGSCSAGAPPSSVIGPASGGVGTSSGGVGTSAVSAAATAAVVGRPSPSSLDQCSFLTTSEIETATGLKVVRSGPEPHYESRCQWTLSGKGNEINTVAMHVELDSPRAAKDQEFSCTTGFGLEPINGVGDSACGQPIEGGSYSLYARRGDDLVNLDISPDATRSIDASAWASLAQAVFAKLP